MRGGGGSKTSQEELSVEGVSLKCCLARMKQ